MSLAKQSLTDSHLKAIGLVAAEWSYTELCLENLIWEVAGINQRHGHAITTHIPSETRINILQALADAIAMKDELNAELNSLLGRLREIRTKRNNIVHSLWISSKPIPIFTLAELMSKKRRRKPTPFSIKFSARGKLVIKNTLMKPKDVLAVAQEITALVTDMYGYLNKIKTAPKSKSLGARGLLRGVLATPGQNQTPDPTPITP